MKEKKKIIGRCALKGETPQDSTPAVEEDPSLSLDQVCATATLCNSRTVTL